MIGANINFHLHECWAMIAAKTNLHLLVSHFVFLSELLRLTWKAGWELSHTSSLGVAKLSLYLPTFDTVGRAGYRNVAGGMLQRRSLGRNRM